MTLMLQLRRRLRFIFRRSEVEREMAEEMRYHLDMRTQDRIEVGLPPAEAQFAARRKFGNVDAIRADSRDVFAFRWLEQFSQDVRYAVRTLGKNKGYSAIALLTLALGIGVNTTAFTVLNRLLLRRVPFSDPSKLVNLVGTSRRDGDEGGITAADFIDLRAQNTVFDHLSAFYVNWLATLAEPGQPAIRCDSIDVTADFFATLGCQAVMLGRAFTPSDELGHERLALISHAFWLKHYGSDPNIIGRLLRTDGGMQYTIVGVMTPAWDDPTLFKGIHDGISFCTLMNDLERTDRQVGWTTVVARLRTGITRTQAQADLTAIARKLAHDYPKTNANRGFRDDPFPIQALDDTGSRLLWLVMSLSGIVLLIACVNLANLQLVRTTGRKNEFGIRLALGSTRARLIRMLLTESMMLSVTGGIVGLAVARWSTLYLAAYWNVDMPLNFRVVLFTFVVASISGAVFGTMPALLASRSELDASMKQSSRGATPDRTRHRMRQVLVVTEIAMALVLLAGAAFFVRGIQRITGRDLGWHPENVVIGYLALDHDHYGEARDPRSLAFTDRIVPELEKLPGVDAVAVSNENVFDVQPVNFEIEGRPPYEKDTLASFETPSPGYFKAFGMHILEGRDFNNADRPGSLQVAVISKDFAHRYWPGESPLGKRIGIEDPSHQVWAVVVGVVNDILHDQEWDTNRSKLAIYYPWSQNSFRFLALTVHTAGNPDELKEEMRRLVGQIEPNIAFSYLDTAGDMIGKDLLKYTVARRMLVQVAGLSLLLAAVGIYGVIANLATERTREIGIRMALGAQARDVVWLFLGNGVRLAVLGTAFGLAGAFGLVRVLGRLVAGFPGYDPGVIFAAAIVLAAVSLLACWLPARGATRVNPINALRSE